MKKRIQSLILSFCFLLVLPIIATAQVILNTETIDGNTPEEISINVTVDNFNDIAAFQFSVNWDINALTFKSVTNFEGLDGLTQGSFNLNVVENGELAVAWFASTGFGIDLASNAVLFTLNFTKLTEVPSEIYFDDTPTPIEFSTTSGIVAVTSNTNEIISDKYLLTGKVLFDENENCNNDDGEKGLIDWMIEIKNDRVTRYQRTNEKGTFATYLPFGDFQVRAIPPPNNYFVPCEPIKTISIAEEATGKTNIDFTGQATIDCPSLSVEIATPFLRRCFENYYSVKYCNNGTVQESDAYVLVELDPFQTFVGSSIPHTQVSGNVYRFDIGKVDFNECDYFDIRVKVDCETTELGQTHCVTAKIFPDLICSTPSANWSGASLELESECVEDRVELRIKNVGDGNMLEPQQFIVVEDMIMLRTQNQETFQLLSGETKTLEYDANGATYRLEANQVPNHPIEVTLATAIEGCGTNEDGTFSKGIINMFSRGDGSQFEDEDCQENRGAYDPNDKNAFPAGYNTSHFLAPNTDITYHIRFQNTGTDTAFNIVVLDTLSELLDVASIVPLVSSHPYELSIVDSSVLKYSFNNIMLPDSNVNLIGSNGFFKFNISQKPDVAIGSLIENSAAIYFDFNDPIITNTYFHTVGFDFVEVRLISSTSQLSPLTMKISPNPMSNVATIQVDNPHHSTGQFQLYDLQGRLVRSYTFSGNTFELEKGDLTAGMYLFEVHSTEKVLGTGKLMIKE